VTAPMGLSTARRGSMPAVRRDHVTSSARRVVPAIPLSPFVLPRATALTDLVLGVDEGRRVGRESTNGVHGDQERDVAALTTRLEERLFDLVDRRASRHAPAGSANAIDGRVVRIGAYHVTVALDDERAEAPMQSAFSWNARTARRTVGLAAVCGLLEGIAATPTDAATMVVADPMQLLREGARGHGSCTEWLTSLPRSARTVVASEGATWATQLWSAIEWERLPACSVGAPDRWWSWPGRVRVALRGRVDVRVGASARSSSPARPGGPASVGTHGAHLVVVPGSPAQESRMGLCLSALVDVLSRGLECAPARVVGWWPESGKAWCVRLDVAALGHAADAVLRAVGRTLAHEGGHR
jgi:hypothetical protein